MIKLKTVRKWHLLLIWPATLSMLIYILSAFAHPLAGWVGPQPQRNTPSRIETDISSINGIEKIIYKHQLSTATSAKLVPFKEQLLLQVTPNKAEVSRYFSMESHHELVNHSQQQALWLAEHFVGEPLKINYVDFKAAFDTDYPASNKLLPVYIIHYDTKDALTVVIHPQSSSLVFMSNHWKRILKKIFRNFHAFDWLNEFEALRLLLVSAMLALTLIMSITGLYFLLIVKRKNTIKKTDRRWHRRLAYLVIVPLFLFSISGFYHLFQSSLYTPTIVSPKKQTLNLADWQQRDFNGHNLNYKYINGISLLLSETALYRITLTENKDIKTKDVIIYINAKSRKKYIKGEDQIIKESISDRLNISLNDIQHSKLIKRFGEGYSFKNKRLPVWQVTLKNGHQYYIDPVNNEIIQFNDLLTRIESFSFSTLHMFGWLKPLIGHTGRDGVFTILLLLSFVLSIVGLTLHLSNTRSRKSVKADLAGVER